MRIHCLAEIHWSDGGKVGLFGWFVGQVMKQSQGKANPVVVNELLKKKLG